MKKIICAVLLVLLFLTGCASGDPSSSVPSSVSDSSTENSPKASIDKNHKYSGNYAGKSVLTDLDTESEKEEGAMPKGTETTLAFSISMIDDTMASLEFSSAASTGDQGISIPIFKREDGTYSGSITYSDTQSDEISFKFTENGNEITVEGTIKVVMDQKWMIQTITLTKTSNLE